uniref:Uncharacterized protein n=1 Tax=Caloglossa intermedia TaxID=100879 RepID=A0A1Z1M5L1_9FLOR|nr:hypothetical protein [Caloglossa intermedia]ARW61357.1 hypothetical protein [Caloglossa intermedia]
MSGLESSINISYVCRYLFRVFKIKTLILISFIYMLVILFIV